MKQYLSVICLVILLSALAAWSRGKDPHSFTPEDCVECHRFSGGGQVASTRKDSSTCMRCHSNITANAYIHPVDVFPAKVGIADGFPLADSGMITCHTCHDPHAPYETPFGSPSRFLRRMERGKHFCDLCHSLKGGQNVASRHQAVLGEAHFQSKAPEDSGADPLDPMSKNCISCHDGSVGSSVQVNLSSGLWSHSRSLLSHDRGGHPIGIDYEMARHQGRGKSDLRPLPQVDRRLRFFNGKIGCGTCHNPFSTEYKNLVMSNKGDQLCMACHRMGGA